MNKTRQQEKEMTNNVKFGSKAVFNSILGMY